MPYSIRKEDLPVQHVYNLCGDTKNNPIEKKNNAVRTQIVLIKLCSGLHFRVMFKTKREIPTALDILILKIWNLGPYIFNKEP